MFKVTKITAVRPRSLAKTYTLSAGALLKGTSAQLLRGRVEVLKFSALRDFADILSALEPSQALVYGVPTDPDASEVVTKRKLAASPNTAGMIARSNEHFVWPDCGGIMMLDYDPAPGEDPMSREELVAVLNDVVPETADTQMIWWQSSSSHICNSDGEDLTGLSGQRIYVPVAEAADIPRAGAALQERLWLKGHGRIVISGSGAMLERTAFDGVVWQPNRLDFAGGAVTGHGLEQRRTAPLILNEDGATRLDSRKALPETDAGTSAEVAKMKESRRDDMRSDAMKVRQEWLDTRRQECLKSMHADTPAEQIATLEDALDRQVLGPDFVLFVRCPGAQTFSTITVAEIFQDPVKYDGCICLDPIEPEYDDRKPTGKLYLSGLKPCLHSFARGGQTWRFSSSVAEIALDPGKTAKATEELLTLMRKDSRFFDYGGALVTIAEAGLLELDEHSLEMMLANTVQFVRPLKDGNLKPIDPPPRILKQVLSLGSARRLKPLAGILDAPTVREDGTLLLAPGYDTDSKLFLNFDVEDYPDIPSEPTLEEAVQATETLWSPFSEFPFVDNASRGALLAGALTAAIRPALPTAPQIHLDAPVYGSGKTLAAEALGTLAAGQRVSVSAPPRPGDDGEMRKLLTTSALPGNSGVLIFDNCSGHLASGALCAFLSSSMWSDRILGTNKSSGVLPTRIFVAVTGTNLSFSGDLNRRTIQFRIDPRVETAFTREFDFCPVAMVLQRRTELVSAALTIIAAAQHADLPKTNGRLASFDVWDRIVRRAVIFAGTELKPGFYADPVEALRERTVSDDDAADDRRLLEALKEEFGDVWFLAKDVADRVNAETGAENLRDIFRDIGRGNRELSSRSTGRHLRSIVDRISGDLVLRSQKKGASCDWKIEVLPGASEAVAGNQNR